MPGGLEYTVKVAGCLRNSPYSPARFSLERMDRMSEMREQRVKEICSKGDSNTLPMKMSWATYFKFSLMTLMNSEIQEDRDEVFNEMMQVAYRLDEHNKRVAEQEKKENDDATV